MVICEVVVTSLLAVGSIWGFPQEEKGTLDYAGTSLSKLENCIHEEDPESAEAVFDALVEYGRAAVPALIRALNEGESMTRLYACHALEKIGPSAEKAIPLLEAAREDPYFDVSEAALRALEAVQMGELTDIEKSPCYRVVTEHAASLLDSYRFPEQSDLTGDWRHPGGAGQRTCVHADFNDDDVTDYATILLHRNDSTAGFVLFAIVSEKSDSSTIARYAVFPLHARREDVFRIQVVKDAPKKSSLVDEYYSIIPVGEGWLELRPPGYSASLRECQFGHRVGSKDLASIDYVLGRTDASASQVRRLGFFWNHSHHGFWRWNLCSNNE